MKSIDDMIAESGVGSFGTTNGFKLIANQRDMEGRANLLVELLGTTALLHKAKRAGRNVLAMVREYMDRHITRAISEISEKPACARGCSHCCHQIVVVSDDEADELAKLVTPAMRARLEMHDADIKAHTVEQRSGFPGRMGFEDSACVFLKDGACSIYDSRPLMCRLVLSQKASACDVFIKDGQKELVPRISIVPAEVMMTSYMQLEPVKPMPTQILERL